MTMLGLLLILLAWILQFLVLGKKQKLDILFLLAYSAGTSFLVIDTFLSGNVLSGVMNLLILSMTVITILKLKK